MELKLLNDKGEAVGTVSAADELFAREYNEPLVHQVVVAYMANARLGTRKQKDRSEVKHSTRKPWRQKGTGRARAGMTSSPLWRKGGKIFPNTPEENFSHKVNRKMFRGAMACILSELVRQDRLNVVENFDVAKDQIGRRQAQGHGFIRSKCTGRDYPNQRKPDAGESESEKHAGDGAA